MAKRPLFIHKRPKKGLIARGIEHWQFWLTSILAIIGTWLVINQNQLMENQNTLIERQMSLDEASRRSALIMLMSNIMDKVYDEIKEQKSELRSKGIPKAAVDTVKFSLSQSLVGQIAALSHSFKPYRYMEGDTLIKSPLSPERGQLLMTLTLLPLDTFTLHKIYQFATFKEADLKGAFLSMAHLVGADLSKASFVGASLVQTDLSWADLSWADFSNAGLLRATFNNTNLYGAVFKMSSLPETYFCKSELFGADFKRAYLRNADFRYCNLEQADFRYASMNCANLFNASLGGADLSYADLSDVNWTIEQSLDCAALNNCKGLHDSIVAAISKSRPELLLKTAEHYGGVGGPAIGLEY